MSGIAAVVVIVVRDLGPTAVSRFGDAMESRTATDDDG